MGALQLSPSHLTVDLRDGDDNDRKLQSVAEAPSDTRVIIRVAPGQPVPLAIETVRARDPRFGSIGIEIDCPHDLTRMTWLEALTHGANHWVEAL